MMRVVVFVPGKETIIGLWQPQDTAPWQQATVAAIGSGGNRILKALDGLLNQSNVPITQVTHIGVMAGPASYTELRMCMATAQTLAWSLDLPIFSFHNQHSLPKDLPRLIQTAERSKLIEPLYPHEIA